MLFAEKKFVAFFLLALTLPICICYALEPDLFFLTWKGRALSLFFLWLIFLELVLAGGSFVHKEFSSFKGWRVFALFAFAAAPSLYVIVTNLSPVRQGMIGLGELIGVARMWEEPNVRYGFIKEHFPISLEYLCLTLFFTIFIWFTYGKNGLRHFAVSLFFLGAIGTVYMADTLYPFGAFTPFQSFVPFTASSAEQVLRWMGYTASWEFKSVGGVELPVMSVRGGSSVVEYGIGWPCAGVQSLFIYTFTILLLLKQMNTQIISKVVYFVIGAVGTYIVNILRVVSIFLIALHEGGAAAKTFHDFYGEFYAITYIVLYLMIVIVVHKKWRKLRELFNRRIIRRKIFSF